MASQRSHHITSREPSRVASIARVPTAATDLPDILNECHAQEQTVPKEVQRLQYEIQRLQKRQKWLDDWCKLQQDPTQMGKTLPHVSFNAIPPPPKQHESYKQDLSYK